MTMEEELEEVGPVHPLAGEVTRALSGVLYPAEREALVHVARENEAPRTLLSLLSSLPDRRFVAQAEVVRALEEKVLPGPGNA
jgi:hypothetical protein